MKFSTMIFDRSKRKKGMDSFEIFQSMRDFFFLLRGLFGGKFCSAIYLPVEFIGP